MTRLSLPTIAVLVLAVYASSACTQPQLSRQQKLASQPAHIVTADRVVPITVEIARTDTERRTGLMGRTSLATNAGMLFVYRSERPGHHGFWMFQTLIPLDIAYLGADGEIRAIRHMAPCQPNEKCPSYPAGQPFSAALEMNQGFFARHGIVVGDRVEWGD
ncbi:DUF192 domain-containing protein [Marinobacter sp. X15-166B]|uniref:DUF192 domain-containing protein n=1 Tax=Marinobacter sp. X15-166B TaxID=1897620 RepID=UPI0009F258E6|nr:DUF192 domain-containing protein [Marinobacter sp. X15-166B]